MSRPPRNMLTADELEALRKHAKATMDYCQKYYGRTKTQEEIDRDRHGDEWWDNYLRRMREEEAKQNKD